MSQDCSRFSSPLNYQKQDRIETKFQKQKLNKLKYKLIQTRFSTKHNLHKIAQKLKFYEQGNKINKIETIFNNRNYFPKQKLKLEIETSYEQ